VRKFDHKIEYRPSETSDFEACLQVESCLAGHLVDYLRGKEFVKVRVTTKTTNLPDFFDLKKAECRIELQRG
jgi:aspartyl/asparaginyl-tRNA synthetase